MSMQIAGVGSAGSLSRGTGITPVQQQHQIEERKAVARSQSSDLEKVSLAFNRRLQFMVDHQSHNITVKVIDRETDKVIKVLPPEELQRMHDEIRETIGFLFDEKV
ncbi:hypothetical protein AGMMS49928_21580 [Spirochaetia bacterium]|nr:hypothetical protein AGMMS49928_21580 [Spirochaetia bacterium]